MKALRFLLLTTTAIFVLGSFNGCTEDPASWISKNYLIEGIEYDDDPLFPGAVIDDISEGTYSGLGIFMCGNGCGPIDLRVSQVVGDSFSLFSLDYVYNGVGGGAAPTVTVIGNLSAGGTVSTTLDLGSAFNVWTTINFGTEWSALDSFVISNAADDSALDLMGFDNLVVTTAVPVPAAVWLFGSSLVGLGWLRSGSPKVKESFE